AALLRAGLAVDEGVRQRRGGHPVAVGAARHRDDPCRVVGRAGARIAGGGAGGRRARSGQPVHGLVLAGGARVRAAGAAVRWIAQISLGTRIKDTGRQFLLGYSGSPSRALSVVVALLALGAGGLAVRHALRSRDRGWWLALAIAAAALALPLAAKAVGADYVFHRNLIGAWAPLALVVGTAAAVPRFGPLALAGLCAALLALTIAVDVDTKLQRADWRSVARAIGGAPQP